MKISVTSKKTNRSVEFENKNIGENFAEAVALVGEEVLYSKYADACVIAAQGRARAVLDKLNEKGEPLNDLAAAITSGEAFKPGVSIRIPGTGRKAKPKTELDALIAQVQDAKWLANASKEDKATAKARIKELIATM